MNFKPQACWILFLVFLTSSCTGQRVIRTCEHCTRNPGSCRRISGLYTVTVLTEGTYNPVVEIPASACSINITELGRSSNYIAVKTSSNKGIVNSYWSLGQPGQYYGAGTRFAYDRGSGNCPGSCIYAEGPTIEKTVVQILYYDKNPGISYGFVLPNSVPFQPFDGTTSRNSLSSSSSASSSSSSPSSSSSSSSSSSAAVAGTRSAHQNRRRYRSHHSRRGGGHSTPPSPRPAYRTHHHRGDSNREYYTGSQTSRSEGRPEETSAQTSLSYLRRRVVPNQRNSYDYTSAKYGSHTLGGRGLSYTALGSSRTGEERLTTNPKSERYVSGTSPHVLVRKISAPQYRASPSARTRSSYSRSQPRYQSLTSESSYRNEVNQRRDNRYRNNAVSTRHNDESGRFRWKISGWTKCSRKCGGGAQKTNIVCVSVSARGQVVVTPENCASYLKPRAQTLECNSSPCKPTWEADQWSECSATCGSGTQTRKIECRQKFSLSLTLRVSADQCGLDKKPAVAQQCEKELCSSWSSGVWGQCTKECGGGERRRDVKCLDGFGSQIPGNYCTEAKPKEREECNTLSCNAQWWTSDWSSRCSELCGSGYQVRSALCMSSDGSLTAESKCSKEDFPELTKPCYGDSGCRGTWFTGAWGRCSAKCGKGKRRRPVICLQAKKGGSIAVSNGECNENLKPVPEESCVNTDCTSLWFTSPWSECSVACGNGFKSRDVSCIDKNGNPSDRCGPEIKPDTREACSLESCSLYQRTDSRLEKPHRSSSDLGSQESTTKARTVKEKDPVKETDQQKQEQRIERDKAKCKDTYWNCLMVVQSRLCQYEYYRGLCCVSCPHY